MNCNVCGSADTELIYQSAGASSLTSLCELHAGQVFVHSCRDCGHLFGPPLPATAEYYNSDYRILLSHEDEDQIYETTPSGITYRTEHQIATLQRKILIPQGSRVLDYGCAKASTPKRLSETRGDIEMHLFDVSEMYIDYWQRFIPLDRYAINVTPEHWNARFDVVTSFFALEHIPEPMISLRHMHRLLKDGGILYFLVPDTFGNVADFVVIDHVNHFTRTSLLRLLSIAGFENVEIDCTSHRGAHVVSATKHSKGTATTPDAAEVMQVNAKGIALAKFWSGIRDLVLGMEARAAGLPAAIYGSGFYGSYIMSTLSDRTRVACFMDRSPFQQGKKLMGVPIVAPEAIPESVKIVYVGLNPSIARRAMNEVPTLKRDDLSLVFLDEVSP